MDAIIRSCAAALACAVVACSSSSSNGTTTSDAGADASSSGDAADAASAVNPGGGTGPAANLACASSGKNAFSTYGAAAFVAVNEQIFANVNAEVTANGTKNLGDSFTKIGDKSLPATSDDLPTFKGTLAAFLVYVYGGPSLITYTDGKSYAGQQDMVAAHTGFAITSAQYDYFLANVVVPALKAKGVPDGDVSSCFAPPLLDAGFKASIVGH